MPANSSLHGLNIIHPAQSSFDAQDLLSGSPFPDISAQLDLWTNLPFDAEEGPLLPRHPEEDEEEQLRIGESALHQGHANVVTATSLDRSPPPPSFDLQSFLSTFGIDHYANQRPGEQSILPNSTSTPSLAQLLAISQQHGVLPPQNVSSSYKSDEPPSKRARTRKASVSTVDSPEDGDSTVPLSASEDKRRRNTAASARFRLKKKEREAALESKAKELETRVNELERECEGLRRENGWLKGLVVGVTGAAQGNSAAAPPSAKRTRDDDKA
ncbi:hypothetical protein C8J56DRAFT_926824 [Mycena floridula]|nr:hypothetical protein C8J56DRAFT_926824 [Mycena floridula]